MLRVIENCCDLQYLEMMKGVAETSDTWNLKHPLGFPFEDKSQFSRGIFIFLLGKIKSLQSGFPTQDICSSLDSNENINILTWDRNNSP